VNTETKPALRRLTRDVTNPRADRRKRDDFGAAPVWGAGTVLRITTHHDTTEINTTRGWGQCSIPEHDDRYALLVAASEPLELDSFDRLDEAYAGRHDVSYRLIVKALVSRGVVPMETLRELLAAHDDLYEEVGEGED
jgi:hypothetical protein